MKILLYIPLFLCLTSTFAQDARLFDTTWYLRNIVVNNTDNFPPTSTLLEFYDSNPYGIGLAICGDFYGSQLTFNNTEETFSIFGGWASGLGNCTNPVWENYRLFYYNFYEGNESTPFEYLVEEDGNDLSLVITADNGDQAFYGNTLLNTIDNHKKFTKLYPNPANNILTVSLTNNDTTSLTIYNVLGSIVMEEVLTASSNQLNIETLEAGIYLMNVNSSDGRQQMLKFIKE